MRESGRYLCGEPDRTDNTRLPGCWDSTHGSFETPHPGMLSDVAAAHEGFSTGLDASAHFDNPDRER